MKQEEVKKIIEEEQLTRINWFEEFELKENEVGIKKNKDMWIVYVTDERASIVDGSEAKFANVEDAYDMLVRKGRYAQKKFG